MMYAGKTVCRWYDAADQPEDTREVLVWARMFGAENYGIARYADDKWHLFIPMTTVLIAAPQNVTVLYWRPLPLSPPENELLDKRREFCKQHVKSTCTKKCPLYKLRRDYDHCIDAVLDYPEEAENLMNGGKKNVRTKDAIHTKDERRHDSGAGKRSEMQSDELERMGTLKE